MSEKNVLGMEQTFILLDWMKGHKQEMGGKGAVAVAEAATKALAFQVTEGNVKSVNKAAGLNLFNVAARGNTNILGRVIRLEQTVAALCTALGHPHL